MIKHTKQLSNLASPNGHRQSSSSIFLKHLHTCINLFMWHHIFHKFLENHRNLIFDMNPTTDQIKYHKRSISCHEVNTKYPSNKTKSTEKKESSIQRFILEMQIHQPVQRKTKSYKDPYETRKPINKTNRTQYRNPKYRVPNSFRMRLDLGT